MVVLGFGVDSLFRLLRKKNLYSITKYWRILWGLGRGRQFTKSRKILVFMSCILDFYFLYLLDSLLLSSFGVPCTFVVLT